MDSFDLEKKHLAVFCAKLGLTELAKIIDLKTVRLWADPDKTPTSLGDQNRQAGLLVGGPIQAM